MLNSFHADLHHLAGGGASNNKRYRGETGRLQKLFQEKKTKQNPFYLLLIEVVGHTVNFKTP